MYHRMTGEGFRETVGSRNDARGCERDGRSTPSFKAGTIEPDHPASRRSQPHASAEEARRPQQ